MPPLSLCPLTIIRATHREMVEAAAAGGFASVGLRLIAPRPGDPVHPLVGDSRAIRDLRQIMDDHGVGLFDIESLWLSPATDPAAARPALEACAELGGRYVLAAGNDPDWPRMVANFAAVCALAAEYGLRVGIEPTSYCVIRALAQADALLRDAHVDNAGILVDALHFARGGGRTADLAAIAPDRFAYAQICDAQASAPADESELMAEARSGRLLPGEGHLPLDAILDALPPGLPIGVEAPTAAFHSLPLNECARLAGSATRAFFTRRSLRKAADRSKAST